MNSASYEYKNKSAHNLRPLECQLSVEKLGHQILQKVVNLKVQHFDNITFTVFISTSGVIQYCNNLTNCCAFQRIARV